MNDRVIVNDVGPRDGLQNQARHLAPADRVRLVRALLHAGMDHVETAAFVSPKAVPAMAGAAEIVAELAGTDATLSVLVPNMKGYELALAAGARVMVMVVYATDGMARANVGRDRAEVDAATADILARAREDGVRVLTTISVSFECPFEGAVPAAVVHDAADRMLALGAERFVVADTIGAAAPDAVSAMMGDMVGRHGADRLGCHFHDTRALGLANVYAAAQAGVRYFDASIAGLGGCPFAPGATGNVATEDVVMLLQRLGLDTGIDMAGLLAASRLADELTGTAPGGRARAWLTQAYADGAG
ncbi:hydroxymethylglutaryl-CoA lyase [Marinihelvus fidelis]|uniref:Hydroxymethylglutaryl-CoA lyase n=1 Tax=Marinihelvus fidelis TaxID=2613842 RepID=A0A5N0THD6_9GAMM|nr:hydroxymethylglutaryl-CoA lyase [Marinihelvus fidelis]KAA9133246.1 hydroxymethylglutaryl-CoA lyase [Marinihelvus fidelis]